MKKEIDLYKNRQLGYLTELRRCAIEDCDFYLEHNEAYEFEEYISGLLKQNAELKNKNETAMKKDYLDIAIHFGLDEQIKHWFTEVYELVQAIERYDGIVESKNKITSELADNFNFLRQIQYSFEIKDEDVLKEQQYKNKRTLEELKDETKGSTRDIN